MAAATPQTNSLNGANPALADERINVLYSDEQRPLTPGEAWRLFVRSWRFIGEFSQLIRLKALLAISSLAFFVLTPWPLKIVIDNVLSHRPLTGIPADLILPLVGNSPIGILMVVTLYLVFLAVIVGAVDDRGAPLGTEVRSGGLDQAGFTANDANDGWSLWNGLFGYLETSVTIDLTQRITQSVRTAVYEAFMDSPLGMYSDQKIGDAVFRVMHDSAAVTAVFYQGVLGPIMSVVLFVVIVVVLLAQFPKEPIIPGLAALSLPIFAVFSTLFGKAFRGQSQTMRESGSNVMAAFEERLSQVQLIKAFGQETRESESIDQASWNSYRSTLKMLAIFIGLVLILMPGIGFLMFYALYHLMREVIRGNLTLGDVVLIAGYAGLLVPSVGTIGNTWAMMQIPAAGLRRIHSVLDRLEAGRALKPENDGIASIDKIEFRDVTVGYSSNLPVLRSVSFELNRGEMVALAGPSGTGKTTLILALPRFLEAIGGSILLDGIDSHQFTPDAIRNHIGFVFQQEALFSTTIEENIRYGRLDATMEQVKEAAEMAGAAEFIERLPDGYATMLGRRGARLSVGQKQRIAIARALLARPDVLILDEPTAPLDTVSENNLIAMLRDLARTRIVLIVAHRPGTLAACDRVLFVREGKLEASGTHTGLIASSSSYRAYLAATESEIHA